jgi:hypothetical protein
MEAKENPMIYRGYELEQKTLLVGWQVTIRKEDVFVRHGSVCKKLELALDEAHEFVDGLITADASGSLPVAP